LKKGTLWKVTKDTIDFLNEELFSCAKSRSKSPNPRLCIRMKTIMHLLKRRKVRAKRSSRMIEALILVIGDVSPTQNLQKIS